MRAPTQRQRGRRFAFAGIENKTRFPKQNRNTGKMIDRGEKTTLEIKF